MPFLFRFRPCWRWSAVSLFVLVASACSSSDDTAAPAPAPATQPYDALFETLPAPTPNKLNGVWSRSTKASLGSADMRLRFSDGVILAGLKCSYTQPGFNPVVTGEPAKDATIEGLDAAKGNFTPSAAFSFFAKPDGRECSGNFEKDAYNFIIQDLKMELTVVGKTGNLIFDKVGD